MAAARGTVTIPTQDYNQYVELRKQDIARQTSNKNALIARQGEELKKIQAALDKLTADKEAANAAIKKQKEAANAVTKKQKEDANAAKKGEISSLRKEVYINGPVAFRPSDKKSSSPSSFIFNHSILVVDRVYFIKTTSELCKYCNALLLLPNETIANHIKSCIRYKPNLYDAYIDWIRQQGKVIENKIFGPNSNLKPLEQQMTAAKEKFDKLLEEYKKDPELAASEAAKDAAALAADKPALKVGQYGSTYAGYRVVTENDISQPLFGKILQDTHINRNGLDTFNPFNVRYELHIEGGKLKAGTDKGIFTKSYSTISCRNQITKDPKNEEVTLRDVSNYFFYMTDGSKNFDNKFKIEKSTVEEKNKSTTPCLFIRDDIVLTEPSAVPSPAAAPAKKGGKQKRNKTHRKYYARRNKKHTRRH